MTDSSKAISRAALVALGLLMVPLVASQVVEGWNWPPRAFVLVYVLFFGTALAYQLIAKKMGSWTHRAAVGLALVTGFVLGWSNMVHMSEAENPAYLVYFGVLVMGGVGAWIARLQARGTSEALFAMAVVLAIMTVVQLLLSNQAEVAARQAIGHAVCAAAFATSGLLFRRSGLAGSK